MSQNEEAGEDSASTTAEARIEQLEDRIAALEEANALSAEEGLLYSMPPSDGGVVVPSTLEMPERPKEAIKALETGKQSAKADWCRDKVTWPAITLVPGGGADIYGTDPHGHVTEVSHEMGICRGPYGTPSKVVFFISRFVNTSYGHTPRPFPLPKETNYRFAVGFDFIDERWDPTTKTYSHHPGTIQITPYLNPGKHDRDTFYEHRQRAIETHKNSVRLSMVRFRYWKQSFKV